MSPPGEVSPPEDTTPPRGTDTTTSTPATTANGHLHNKPCPRCAAAAVPCVCSFYADWRTDRPDPGEPVGVQLRRRRRASFRCVPLSSGRRDPWSRSQPRLSPKVVDAGRDAALHVLGTGKVPLLEVEVLRALWRRGGADRVLAQELYDLAGGEIG